MTLDDDMEELTVTALRVKAERDRLQRANVLMLTALVAIQVLGDEAIAEIARNAIAQAEEDE